MPAWRTRLMVRRSRSQNWRPPDGFLERHTTPVDSGSTNQAERKRQCKYCHAILFKGQRVRAHFHAGVRGARTCHSSAARGAIREMKVSERSEPHLSQPTIDGLLSAEATVHKYMVEAFAGCRIPFRVAESAEFRKYIEEVAKAGQPYPISRKRLGGEVLDLAVETNRMTQNKWLNGPTVGTMTLDSWTEPCTKQKWTAIMYCSQGREVLADLIPHGSDPNTDGNDAVTSKRIMKVGLSSIASMIAQRRKVTEADAVKSVIQITTDNAPGYLVARRELARESGYLENHCLLHAVQNAFKEIFNISELKSVLNAVLNVIGLTKKSRVYHTYESIRRRFNDDVRRAQSLRKELQKGSSQSSQDENFQLLALPKRGTHTAHKLGYPGETRFATNFIALQDFVHTLPVMRDLEDISEISTAMDAVNVRLTKDIVKGLEPLYAMMRLGDSSKSGGISKAHAAFLRIEIHFRNLSTTEGDLWDKILSIVIRRWKCPRTGWHREYHALAYALDPEFWHTIDAYSDDARTEMMRDMRPVLRKLCGCPSEDTDTGTSVDVFSESEEFFSKVWAEYKLHNDPSQKAKRDNGWGEGTSTLAHGRQVAMCSFWQDLKYGHHVPHLARIAEQLGSLTPSAASPERLWSRSGWICDKLRSKLTKDRARKLIVLKSDMSEPKHDVIRFHPWRDDVMISGDSEVTETSDDEDSEDSDDESEHESDMTEDDDNQMANGATDK